MAIFIEKRGRDSIDGADVEEKGAHEAEAGVKRQRRQELLIIGRPERLMEDGRRLVMVGELKVVVRRFRGSALLLDNGAACAGAGGGEMRGLELDRALRPDNITGNAAERDRLIAIGS